MLYECQQEDRYKDYTAVVQKVTLDIIAARTGADINLPKYIEYMYPETVKKETPEDIKAHILEKLRQ